MTFGNNKKRHITFGIFYCRDCAKVNFCNKNYEIQDDDT